MKLFLTFKWFAFTSLLQIIYSQSFKLSTEYNSLCTLLPQKHFTLIGSGKKAKGRLLAKTYTSLEAPAGKCMSLCAEHELCNAVNYKNDRDTENCLLILANRIVDTDDAPGWLAYSTVKTCIPGCYRNAGMCMQQINASQITGRAAPGVHSSNLDNLIDGALHGHHPYIQAQATGTARQLIWVRMEFGKMFRVVRVILYILGNGDHFDNQAFAVKVGAEDVAGSDGVTKAKYCAHDVSKYPGEEKVVPGKYRATRKDIYCDGPLEGKFVYLSKYTTTVSDKDALLLNEAIVFVEKI